MEKKIRRWPNDAYIVTEHDYILCYENAERIIFL